MSYLLIVHTQKNMHYNKKRIVAIETLNGIIYMAQIHLRWLTFGPSGTLKGTKYLGVEGGSSLGDRTIEYDHFYLSLSLSLYIYIYRIKFSYKIGYNLRLQPYLIK